MIRSIGVVGAGAMGRGIALLFATAGQQVWLYDQAPEMIDQALAFNRELLERSVAKGRLEVTEMHGIVARQQPAEGLDSLVHCDLVIEAVLERLDVKQGLMVELEARVKPTAILATNTSSLSVTQIASLCQRPGRVAGYHFFNPVTRMKLVEVVRGACTEDDVVAQLVALAEQAGHFAAVTPDTPGFLVNHLGRAYATEAQRLLSEGVATPAQIDRILRDGPGFAMGPFELADLTGLDITQAVTESIYQQHYQDARYMPSPLAAQRVAAGLWGRKRGAGYYAYVDGQPVGPAETRAVPVVVDRPFWLQTDDVALPQRLGTLLAAAGTILEQGAEPSPQAICLITPLGEDASAAIHRLGLPPERTLALDTFCDFDRRRVLMGQPALAPWALSQAHCALEMDGVPVEVINDSPGFVTQRVIASVVNLGCEIAQRRIADPITLERAIPLALGYPMGPLGFGEHYGAARVLKVLRNIQACQGGEPRYRPSLWLRRRVELGVSLMVAEG